MTHEPAHADHRTPSRPRPPLIPDARPAHECSNMHEIRAEIDRIDHVIIGLLCDRLTYVHAAAKFKTSDESVRALDRVETMLQDRERWATDHGLHPTVIRRLYEDLIRYFTNLELDEWSSRRRVASESDVANHG
jgi:isochorismate pyruvate lyase